MSRKLPVLTDMPDILPIFPLSGVLLLPGGQLPLNIFEPRYMAMIDDALCAPSRMVGMIQPRTLGGRENGEIYQTGCAGRITSFAETDDGRYLITLSGVCRFAIRQELRTDAAYRRVQANWEPFTDDLAPHADTIAVDRKRLNNLLKTYFRQQELSCDWDKVELTGDVDLLTALAMICPLKASEKQAILEAPTIESRTEIFLTMIEMAISHNHIADEDDAGCCH
ncbi:MAG TPA: LON peptidase substrate-binding domain-containing protein [Alphaproteobacteria bacterium]